MGIWQRKSRFCALQKLLCFALTHSFKADDIRVMSNYNNCALSQDTSWQLSALMRSICWLVPSAGAYLHPSVTNMAFLYTINKETHQSLIKEKEKEQVYLSWFLSLDAWQVMLFQFA